MTSLRSAGDQVALGPAPFALRTRWRMRLRVWEYVIYQILHNFYFRYSCWEIICKNQKVEVGAHLISQIYRKSGLHFYIMFLRY